MCLAFCSCARNISFAPRAFVLTGNHTAREEHWRASLMLREISKPFRDHRELVGGSGTENIG